MHVACLLGNYSGQLRQQIGCIGLLLELKSNPKEALSVLMVCMPSNCRRPFLYHMEIAD